MANHVRCLCQLLATSMLMAAISWSFQTVGAAVSWDDDLQLNDEGVPKNRRVLLDSGVVPQLVNSTSEAEILLGFREGVTSDLNGALGSWNETLNPDFCSWIGVTCDLSGHVSSLSLSGRQLEGTISPLLGHLTFLSSLDLAENSFNGKIPPSLGQLKHLQHLDISKNKLQQNIPPEISNCSSLTYLNLSSNSLGGFIPSELGILRNVSEVDLNNNGLTFSVPRSLGNCSSLQFLDISANQLTGTIPQELGRLRRLTHLLLLNNSLTGSIPKSITNCTLLETLDLSLNTLTGAIVPEVGLLRNLIFLSLAWNPLTGSIPSSLGNLSSLYTLMLGGTRANVPLIFGPNPNPARNSQLTGHIPPELGKLQNLDMMWLFRTSCIGSIPPELGNMSNLTRLHFYANVHLTAGRIQPALGNLTKLTILNLVYSNLVGEIPGWIGGLTSLGWLDLRYNNLTGHIPAELGNLASIWRMLFSHNHLSGPLIPELGQLVTIQELGLDSNNFTGHLPPTLRNCIRLEYLFINDNSLSGFIPRGMLLSSLPSLVSVNIAHNQLSGPIPEFGANLNSLLTIDFSFNNLSGPIHPSIQNCKALMSLNFSNNHLTGELPIPALEQLLGLTSFTVANNSLEGPIPDQVGAFANVTAADYAGNLGLCGALLRKNCTTLIQVLPSKNACRRIRCHRKWIYVVSGVTAGFLLAAITIWAVFFRKASEKKPCEHPNREIESKIPDISLYTKELILTTKDLWTATEGFSELNIVGVGGHSTVYKAVLPHRDGMIIAVKCLNLDAKKKPAAAQDFYHELQILGNLRHRNLVKLHGFCATPPLNALLLEFVSNGSLHWHLHKGNQSCRLSLETRLHIGIDVANAMVYLHHESHEPVIHRDLKPNNILLDSDFNAKVADFGIAKYVHQDSNGEATASGLFGTTGYIAPEYTTSNKVSTRGDVYSYGVILLEMLTGKRPTDDAFAKKGTWLVDWVRQASPHRIPTILDDTLNSEFAVHEEQIYKLVRVGLLCTRDAGKDRPSMKDVKHMLMQVKLSSTAPSDKARYPTLVELAHMPTSKKSIDFELGPQPLPGPRTIHPGYALLAHDSPGSGSRTSSSTLNNSTFCCQNTSSSFSP